MNIDLSKLNPPLSGAQLKRDLVAQFLRHDGYVATAKSFAAEAKDEILQLEKQPQASLENYNTQHDADAVYRQRKIPECLGCQPI